MQINSRNLVYDTLNFKNYENRIPRQLWSLPWAENNYPEMIKKLNKDFVWDFAGCDTVYEKKTSTYGNPYEIGEYIDEWDCVFTNIQRGIIGEVKKPLILDDNWNDSNKVHIPEELLSFDIGAVNNSYKKSKKFMFAGCCPRPFEQLQFIRGTANLYMDLISPPKKMLEFIEKMHDFYCRLLKKWAKTDVDALNIMDDWGSQNNLLISPDLWNTFFKPLYRDYIDIAHSQNKKIFMHSDGNILKIIPSLIDLGLDALNSQIFCMGVENIAQFKGKITFWGEIDRQHIIPNGTKEQIINAVENTYKMLWADGGCIAQCEFGIGANPENIYEIYKAWDNVRSMDLKGDYND